MHVCLMAVLGQVFFCLIISAFTGGGHCGHVDRKGDAHVDKVKNGQ